ncbi:energy-coupling factor transporter transmembrane component T [Companilactobacillus farciminis]|uniref:energy-coupling factor transporter transmembrane component T n=1 Tax=Companilactobacillus farciminis TaxID=1612 RepID=UPI002330A801|nr:energy-coupling factor transporter transmembrane component T [Companilactobacillus farciminis]WCG34881.1 energy-coupling factor transporter transmembrane component T [Companilactobacillus farciminis]
MNQLVFHFQKNTNNLAIFAYLVNVILISLLFNNPIIIVGVLVSLLVVSFFTRQEKFKTYCKFSGLIFLVTVLFNLILNQRGNNLLLTIPFVKVTLESLSNGIILGISFVNLLWAFYLYDALIRIKVIFELLAKFFKSVAVVFVLTIKFIPQIIAIYRETKELNKFRVYEKPQKFSQKIKVTLELTEVVLNKAIANFMNVADALTLKGYEQRQQKIGKTDFKNSDWAILMIVLISVIVNLVLVILKIGKINFGSANLLIQTDFKVWLVMIFDSLLILLPLIIGGWTYLWWKYYVSKTTASNTTTVKDFR